MSWIDLLYKHYQYTLAVLSASIYVWQAHKDLPAIPRTAKVASSAGIGVSTGGEVSDMLGTGHTLTTVALVTLCWVMLDFSTSLFKDRKLLLEILLKLRTGK